MRWHLGRHRPGAAGCSAGRAGREAAAHAGRDAGAGRGHLCINRHKFRPPRPAYQPVAAPRQAELVPGEEAFGVRRDDAEQRVVVMPSVALRALRLAWDKIAPQGWNLFCAEWGARWGRLAMIDLDTELLEQRGRPLRERPLDDALELIRAQLEQDGWGQLTIDVTSPAAISRGAAIIRLDRSALAEAAGASAVPRCQAGEAGGAQRVDRALAVVVGRARRGAQARAAAGGVAGAGGGREAQARRAVDAGAGDDDRVGRGGRAEVAALADRLGVTGGEAEREERRERGAGEAGMHGR